MPPRGPAQRDAEERRLLLAPFGPISPLTSALYCDIVEITTPPKRRAVPRRLEGRHRWPGII